MFAAVDGFEKAQKSLAKAIKKKDQTASSRALEDLSTNLRRRRGGVLLQRNNILCLRK
jgi:hypothetical protein